MSSEPHRNFFLLGMDSIVYKYDLVSKELLFKFHADATVHMNLYDGDDKLLVASEHNVRLWDFQDAGTMLPELWSSEEFPEKIEHVFLNEHSRGSLKLIVLTQDKFYVYKNRLEKEHEIQLEGKKILCCAFNYESTEAFFGDDSGKIYTWNLTTGEQKERVYVISSEFNLPVTSIERFLSVQDENLFLVTIDNQSAELYYETRSYNKPINFEYTTNREINEDMMICN